MDRIAGPAPARPSRRSPRAILAALVVFALAVLVVVIATRPDPNRAVGVGGPTGRPSVPAVGGSGVGMVPGVHCQPG